MDLLQIPEALKAYPNFVGWKWEPQTNKRGEPVLDKDGNSVLTKPPYDLKSNGTLRHAMTNNPKTWTDFNTAIAIIDDCLESKFDGIGFVLPEGMGGIDFDGVIDDEKPEPYVLEILKHLGNPYTEISPSGNGLRAFINTPTLPINKGCNFKGKKEGVDKYGAEFYIGGQTNKYLTVTGAHFSGSGISTPTDINLVHFLMSQFGDEKFKALWMGEWQKAKNAKGEVFSSQSEADLALCSLLVRGGFNSAETLDAAFRQSRLMRDEWEHKSKYTIAKALSGKESKASTASATDLVFSLPAVEITEANDGDYVLARIPDQSDENEDGWFPRGEVSLIGAPSGAGKTTTMYQLLLTQQCGGVFLGHASHGLSFCVMGVDRGKPAHRRTMKRMRMRPDSILFEGLALSHDFNAVQQIILKIESYTAKSGALPAVVLVEGVDMLVSKVNDILCVSKFMNLLVQVAAHYHVAIIGTLGSPKIKIGQGYTCLRDNVLGSGGWSRECETMIVIQFPQGPPAVTKGRRVMTVMPRNAKEEFFTLGFDHGQLIQVPDIEEADTDNPSEEIEWFRTQSRIAKTDPTKIWFTALDFERAFKMAHSTASRRVGDAVAKKYLRVKSGKKVGKGATKQYQWNASKSNPLWATQQTQAAEEQMEAFS